MELESYPGCYLWIPFIPAMTWAWSAGCAEGITNGSGTLKLIHESDEIEITGSVQNGKLTGHRVIRNPKNGNVNEGPYVDGKRHGLWVCRQPSGRTETVTYVNDVRQ